MRFEGWRVANSISVPTWAQRIDLGRLMYYLLFGLGVLFLLASMTYATNALLKSWIIGRDRYLVAQDIAPLPVVTMGWMGFAEGAATPALSAVSQVIPTLAATPTLFPGITPAATPVKPAIPSPSATFVPTFPPTAPLLPSVTSTAPIVLPPATATTMPSPVVEALSPPVKIRIPSLDVKRSVIRLPQKRDRRTGATTWDTKKLFRSGRKDLVGHSEGSAYPGEEGNMILVGHNYGYGYNGVFVRLNRLKPGRNVYVVNSDGQTFTYEVKTVKKVKWRRQNFGELTQHLSFLASGGTERLTLVSCSGADVEPFPERIYVVAEPVR